LGGFQCSKAISPAGILSNTLEVNHHVKSGGSFWMMINPQKKWWFVNQPIENGLGGGFE